MEAAQKSITGAEDLILPAIARGIYNLDTLPPEGKEILDVYSGWKTNTNHYSKN